MERNTMRQKTIAVCSSSVIDNQTATYKGKYFPGSLTQKFKENFRYYPGVERNEDVLASKPHCVYELKKRESGNHFPGSLSYKYEAVQKYQDVDVSQFKRKEEPIRSSSEESNGRCSNGHSSPRIIRRKRKKSAKNKRIKHPEKLSNKWRENLRFLDIVPDKECGGDGEASEVKLQCKDYGSQQVNVRLADAKLRCNRLQKLHKRKRLSKTNTLSKKLKANLPYLAINNDTPVGESAGSNIVGDDVITDKDCKSDEIHPNGYNNKEEAIDSSVKDRSSRVQTRKRLAKKLEENMQYLNISKSHEDNSTRVMTYSSRSGARYSGSLSKKWEKNLCYLDVCATGNNTDIVDKTTIESNVRKHEMPELIVNTNIKEIEQKHTEATATITWDGDKLLTKQATTHKLQDVIPQNNKSSEYTTRPKPSVTSPKKRLDDIICFLHNRKNQPETEILADRNK